MDAHLDRAILGGVRDVPHLEDRLRRLQIKHALLLITG
jgi:hypothetical protein